MVEKSESIAPQSEGKIPKPEKILASMDWEQRLAVARAQRAEIQAELSKASEEHATENPASCSPKPWDNSPEHPTSASKGFDSRSLSDSDKSTNLEFRRKILGAEVVPESLDWEDRIERIRDQRQGNLADHEDSSERSSFVRSDSLRTSRPESPRRDAPVRLPPNQESGNGVDLRNSRPQQTHQSTALTVGAMPIATSAEQSRGRISGWRTVAGFAVGAAFGLAIASSDVLIDAAQQVRTGFSIASSNAPSAMTLVEVWQIPKAEVATPSTIATAIDAPIDRQIPVLLTASDSAETRPIAVPSPSVVRPNFWNPPQIVARAESLSDAPAKPDMSTDLTAYAALAPNLANLAESDAGTFVPESEDWFRTATQTSGFIPLTTPVGLSVLAEGPSKPSVEIPELAGSVASAGTLTTPALQRRAIASGDQASTVAGLTLASTGWVLHRRPAALTSPEHEYRIAPYADIPPPIVRSAETPAYARISPVLVGISGSEKTKFVADTDDWFRMTTLKSGTLRLAAPAGFTVSEENWPKPLTKMPALSNSFSQSGALPSLVLQTLQDNRLPDHFSTVPDTPEFVKRSAASGFPEPKPRPAPTLSEPVDFSGVLVHILAPSSVSDERLNGVANTLKNAGYPIKDPARVNFTIRQNNVRFYSAKDAETARALAKIVGGTARDFTSFSPSPPTGTIEVWFAGATSSKTRTAKAAPARTKPARTKRQPSKADQDLIRLRNRLVDQLRRGDHL